ncbi:MAG TPA: hypothetical protein G4N95_05810 [Anaerolineae bacterium]|nr:hypothetical protein [Anaerolineae bacterium]
MDIFFTNPNDIPLPPNEVKIRALRAEPYPDKKRIRIYLEVTPFQKRPFGELVISDEDGIQVAIANIIEPMSNRIEVVLHIRKENPVGKYTLKATISFADEMEEGQRNAEKIVRPEFYTVDTMETSFEIVE